jgi:hypothetical protein
MLVVDDARASKAQASTGNLAFATPHRQAARGGLFVIERAYVSNQVRSRICVSQGPNRRRLERRWRQAASFPGLRSVSPRRSSIAIDTDSTICAMRR